MLRIVVTICAVSQLATALPQRQLGGLRPNPNPQPSQASPAASSLGAFSPAYNQKLQFGNAQVAAAAQAAANAAQIRGRVQSPYQSPQPIILSQAGQTASPATPAFAAFGGASPFGGAGRQILTLRSPGQAGADEDEYEYEDDDEPTIQSRPSPRPSGPTRTPVRQSAQSPANALGLNTGRFVSQQQQQQQQQQRQRQPIQTGLNYQQQQQAPLRQSHNNAQFGFDGKRSRLTTPAPVQTVNRYMKQNEDGSVTWGYENEDGTFKEETLGADCVVKGKYGYVDPDGNKREYEYQTGNPCDPNKKNQEEEEEEDLPDGPSRPQQISGLLNARPRPLQQRRPQQQQGQIPQYQPQPQYALS